MKRLGCGPRTRPPRARREGGSLSSQPPILQQVHNYMMPSHDRSWREYVPEQPHPEIPYQCPVTFGPRTHHWQGPACENGEDLRAGSRPRGRHRPPEPARPGAPGCPHRCSGTTTALSLSRLLERLSLSRGWRGPRRRVPGLADPGPHDPPRCPGRPRSLSTAPVTEASSGDAPRGREAWDSLSALLTPESNLPLRTGSSRGHTSRLGFQTTGSTGCPCSTSPNAPELYFRSSAKRRFLGSPLLDGAAQRACRSVARGPCRRASSPR